MFFCSSYLQDEVQCCLPARRGCCDPLTILLEERAAHNKLIPVCKGRVFIYSVIFIYLHSLGIGGKCKFFREFLAL